MKESAREKLGKRYRPAEWAQEEVEGWTREGKPTASGLAKEGSGLVKSVKSCGQEELSPGQKWMYCFNHQEVLGSLPKKHFPCSDECKRQIAVGWRTRRRYWSGDGQCRQFLKLSCEEERGTEGDVEAGRGFWFPDGKDLSFYKWGQEGGNKEGTVKNVGDRRNGCCAWESKERPQISGGNWP